MDAVREFFSPVTWTYRGLRWTYRRVKSLIVVDRVEPSEVDVYIAKRRAALSAEPPEAPSEPVERLADYWVPTTDLEIEQATTIEGEPRDRPEPVLLVKPADLERARRVYQSSEPVPLTDGQGGPTIGEVGNFRIVEGAIVGEARIAEADAARVFADQELVRVEIDETVVGELHEKINKTIEAYQQDVRVDLERLLADNAAAEEKIVRSMEDAVRKNGGEIVVPTGDFKSVSGSTKRDEAPGTEPE